MAYGRNDKQGTAFNAILGESTHTFGLNSAYGRLETLQVESDVLRFGSHNGGGHSHGEEAGGPSWVTALTLGGARTLSRWSDWDIAAGGDVTFYRVPGALKPTHGDNPVSFHVFLRVRPPAPMGRMFDMTMTGGGH